MVTYKKLQPRSYAFCDSHLPCIQAKSDFLCALFKPIDTMGTEAIVAFSFQLPN